MRAVEVRYYGASIVFGLVTACYLAVSLPWPWWAIAIVLAPLTTMVIQIPMYVLGLSLGDGDHHTAQSRLLTLLMLAASVHFAMQSGWIRYVAFMMLAGIAVSVLASTPPRRLILSFVFIAPFLLIALWRWSPVVGIALVVISHALVLYATLAPNSRWLGPVITRFETEAHEVWLTIDDGPTADTAALLDLLDAKRVRATFFVKGQLSDTDSLAAMEARGHTIGNHSWSHPSSTFWCLGPRAIEREIEHGVRSPIFRAPVGMKNPFVHPALAKRGMALIGWTARGFDATRGDAGRVAARIVSRLRPGAIIVMHQGREWSLRCIERVIDEVQMRGYRFVLPDLKTNR